MSDEPRVELTHDEAVLIAGMLMGEFGRVAVPPAYAHLTAELMNKLPGLNTPKREKEAGQNGN